MKYLIIGTGGVGGCIASFLKLGGKDVACIARGTHLETIQEDGLHLKSDLKGEHFIKIPAYTTEEYTEKADIIFVCIKGYSINSISDIIKKASKPTTLVIPILNVYGTGPHIQELVPDITVIDGCIYIVGFVDAPGCIRQMGKVFHLVIGARAKRGINNDRLITVKRDMEPCGINVRISDDIDRDTFLKWIFISSMACTGAYHNCPMGPLQHEGEERNTFIGLTEEATKIGEKRGIILPDDILKHNLEIIDNLDPETTSSLQKDLAKNHQSEIKGQLFDMIDMARKYGIETPTYDKVEKKFINLR